MRLHVFPASPNAMKVLALAYHLELPFEEVFVNLSAGEQKKPGFLALNPNGRMPVLEDGDFVLWESNAILEYLADTNPQAGLLPQDPQGRANVLRWLFWQSAHMGPAVTIVMYERVVKRFLGVGAPDEARVVEGLAQFSTFAAVLEQQLAKHGYVAGDRLTVADFSLASLLAMHAQAGIPLDEFPHVKAWFERFAELPGWRRAMARAAEVMRQPA